MDNKISILLYYCLFTLDILSLQMKTPRIKTTFNPIVLFNNDSSSSENSTVNRKPSLSDHERIEKHRINVKKMLDTNAKLWESSWGYESYDSDPICSGTGTILRFLYCL